MERWAANTLRTLGIVLLAAFILITSLILLLFSVCAWQGGFGGGNHPGQGLGFLIAAVVLLGGGIWGVARLSRSLLRSVAAVTAQSASPVGEVGPASSEPFHMSPRGLRAVNLLAQTMGAQIALSVLCRLWNQFHYFTAAGGLAHPNWTWILLGPYVFYVVAYAILIYKLVKQPDRHTFAYSLAVPSVILFQSLFSLSIFSYVRQPAGFLLLLVPWLVHILILVLAYKAIQQVGLHPEPPLLVRAALVTLGYFFFVHVAPPLLLYRMSRR
jgi:hypothetical protein